MIHCLLDQCHSKQHIVSCIDDKNINLQIKNIKNMFFSLL